MRKYSPGHLARRVRRTLGGMGYKAAVNWIDRPSYSTTMPERIMETRVLRDGAVHIMHHSSCVPGTDVDVYRIVHALTEGEPGVREDEIAAVRARYGEAVRKGDGMWSLVTRYHGGVDARMRILVPVDLLDLLGRVHPMVIDWSGPAEFRTHSWATRHLDCDRSRRDVKGGPKGVRVGGGLAAVLRSRVDGLERAARLFEDVAATMSKADLGDDMSEVTIVMMRGGDDEVRWRISGREIHVDGYRVPGGEVTGDRVSLDQTLPEQIAVAMAGRPLGELVEGLPLDPAIVVKEARTRRRPRPGTTLRLSVRPIAIEDLVKELGLR